MNEITKVEYQSLSGINVVLDAETVRNTITKGNGKVTDQEVAMFLRTCQAKKLDPLENGETYLVKYRDDQPAQMVVGYFAYMRRADRFPNYRGFKAGITVTYTINGKYLLGSDGLPVIKKKEGAALYPMLGEVLIGGWCEVYRQDASGAVGTSYMEVALSEYNTGKSNWSQRPATMIRKVAISQAFRAAFPNEYEGLYTDDEMIAAGAIPPHFKSDNVDVVDAVVRDVPVNEPVQEAPVENVSNDQTVDYGDDRPITHDEYVNLVNVIQDRFKDRDLCVKVYLDALNEFGLTKDDAKMMLATVYKQILDHINGLDPEQVRREMGEAQQNVA